MIFCRFSRQSSQKAKNRQTAKLRSPSGVDKGIKETESKDNTVYLFIHFINKISKTWMSEKSKYSLHIFVIHIYIYRIVNVKCQKRNHYKVFFTMLLFCPNWPMHLPQLIQISIIPSRHVDTIMCPESIFDRGEKFQISVLQFPSICAQECLHKL